MKNTSRFVPVLLLIAFFIFSPEARADTVVITGGTLIPSRDIAQPEFSLVGQGLAISGKGNGGGVVPASNNFYGKPAGSIVNLNAGFYDLGWGPATVNGVFYPRLYYIGEISFSGSVVVPDVDSPLFELTAPFTFQGTITGYDFNRSLEPPIRPPIFSTMLTGQGIATVELMSVVWPDGVRRYTFQGVTYTFQPAAVPEPTTLLLLGTGLTGIVGVCKRRRNQGRHE